MLRIYPVEFSCVGGVYSPVGCRDPVSNSAANGIEVGHDDMHDAARCVFVNIGVNRVTSSFAFGKIGKMRLNRKQKKHVAAIVMLRLLRKRGRSGKYRKVWCRQWIANHDRQGAYSNLFHDHDNYRQSPDKGTHALAINLPVYPQVLHSKQTPFF